MAPPELLDDLVEEILLRLPPPIRGRSAAMAPPELLDDVVEQILLRLPPDDPACLLRAALVCKPWLRRLTSAGFLRRYRRFHRAPPTLGFFRNQTFVPTASFRPRASPVLGFFRNPNPDADSFVPRDPGRRVLDCRHGRVLLDHSTRPLVVWDPLTGEERHVRHPDVPQSTHHAAVMCAAAGCDHLDCHGGPFLIAFVGTQDHWPHACLYSSESGGWSTPTTLAFQFRVDELQPVLAGGHMYFVCGYGKAILRFDLSAGEGGLWGFNTPLDHCFTSFALIPPACDDGGLRYAGLERCSLYLWSLLDHGKVAQWTQLAAIELDTLLPSSLRARYPCLIGTAPRPDESDVVLVKTGLGVFAIRLKSRGIRKLFVIESPSNDNAIFPYMAFFTPDCMVRRLKLQTASQ